MLKLTNLIGFGFNSNKPWDISNAAYYGKNFDVSTQEGEPHGLFFKDDGTKMYIVGIINATVYQYSLSTAWDVSTSSYDSKSFSVASQEATPRGLFFKDDGAKMYAIGYTNDTVYQYSLSSAWDISTASYDSKSFSVASQDTSPSGLFFKGDGTKMYIVGLSNVTIYQYTLSSAWDVSTASYDSKSFLVSGQEATPRGLFFKDDGTKLYVVGYTSDTVYQYTLATAWDVSTSSYDSKSFSVSGHDSFPVILFFKDDGTKMYVLGYTNDTVYQYVL